MAVTSATVIIYGEAIADPVKLIQKFDSTIVIFVCDARHFCRAVDDKYGGKRRFAVK